jgi:protein arginine kinase activator
MLCQDCKKREAQVHLTQIINNEKISLALCKECASARGFHSPLENNPFPLAELLTNFAKSMEAQDGLTPRTDLVCPNCKLTFDDFTRLGRFGCGDCYRTFRPRLEGIMRKIHGASLHRGTAPIAGIESEPGEQTIPVKEEDRLETELRKAIDAEDFERAAEIRDKLKSIKQGIVSHS